MTGTRSFSICSLLLLSLSAAASEFNLPNASGYLPSYSDSNKQKLPEYRSSERSADIALPSVPDDQGYYRHIQGPSFELKGVEFEGNTIFTDKQLQHVMTSMIGKKVVFADIEEMRYRLTRFYTSRGYINSGALIKPDQTINNGVVAFEIIEGRLGQIHIDGTEGLNSSYVAHRIWPDDEEVFNTKRLQERFGLLLNDPLIESMNGRLSPGIQRDLATLDLELTRAKPYSLKLTVDNSGAPSTGSERIQLDGVVRNLTGYGDALSLAAYASKGATSFDGNFNMPIDSLRSDLQLRYDTTDSKVVAKPLKEIDIESEYEAFELGLNHQCWKEPSGSLSLGASIVRKENSNTVLGQPFPLSEGEEEDGKSKVFLLRLLQDYQYREKNWVLALRSTFNIGLEMLDATVHDDDLPDSQFVSWIGQLQYARRIFEDSQLVLRGNVQLSGDELLPMEKYSLGGFDTVRGYRENTLVKDNGYMLSAELHYPLLNNQQVGTLELISLMDFGAAWNYDQAENCDELFSIGVGTAWVFGESNKFELYLAHDIEKAQSYYEYNLQDSGIHFRFTYGVL